MTYILAENFTCQLRPRYIYATFVFLTRFLDLTSFTSYGHYPITLFPATVSKIRDVGQKDFCLQAALHHRRPPRSEKIVLPPYAWEGQKVDRETQSAYSTG